MFNSVSYEPLLICKVTTSNSAMCKAIIEWWLIAEWDKQANKCMYKGNQFAIHFELIINSRWDDMKWGGMRRGVFIVQVKECQTLSVKKFSMWH